MLSEVSSFIDNATQWGAEMKLLRTILLNSGLTESYKWRKPCYTYNEQIVVMIQPFKTHCDLGFFKGALLKDKDALLEKAGEHTQAARQMRFTSTKDIIQLKQSIAAYLKEAMDIATKEIKFEPKENDKTIIIEELDSIFKKNKALQKAFLALTPGRQRAYLIHFAGAKQSATRIARIEKYAEAILAGRGISDCTCGLSKKMPYCDGSHKYANKA